MWENIQIFGFRALWSPYYFIAILSIAVLYVTVVRGRFMDKFTDATPATRKQMTRFLGAMALLYIVKGSPLDLLGHMNFSFHMVQMSLLYLAIPPLLILGTPDWLLRAIVNTKGINQIFKLFSKPLLALFLFNGSFSMYHFPGVFDFIKTDSLLHAAVTGLIFIFAFFMWIPLIAPLPEYDRMSDLFKMGYLFANGLLLSPACALIIFSNSPLYATYYDPEHWVQALALCVPASLLNGIDVSNINLFSFTSLQKDQQLGGIIMKIVQEIIYGMTLGYVFFRWVRNEKIRGEEEVAKYMTPQPSDS
ncbi:cytochrome c oxidase assembly factor CtaG [Bacillus solimangrovi]|uniref:Cytochrome c oxidase assembly factor CtaG n=1 Tax=Bacillus solimangrovi TaxID=1305675 RepID=A0A1E5LIN7_9BACI|nr:cytochrome c oxidase assembly factor CtaG [Bacillus solimangrovi]OEH93918.1 cytochrome c oxidase assembly factor CtaG [Bacillus solimangrovi]